MVEKETQLQKMKRLSDKQENIRNICTSAHIHHGKCVAPATRLHLTDGTLIGAEQLYTLATTLGTNVRDDEQETVYDITGKGISVFSLNKETGILEKKEISHAWKLQGGTATKIKLRTGAEITTTPEHKYITLENMEFVEKEARDINLHDRIVCARKIDVESSKNLKEETLQRLSKTHCYAQLRPSEGKQLLKKVQEKGIHAIAEKIGMKTKSFYHGLWRNRCRVDHLIKLSELISIPLTQIYDVIHTISFRETTKNTKPIRLPQNFEQFFTLTGLLFGDGSGHKFIVVKEELAQQFINACKELGIQPARKDYGNRTPEIQTNKTLSLLLNALFEYPLKKKSHNIRASDFLTQAPASCVSNFLKAYFDCDGTVEKSRGAISLTSVSKQMLRDVQSLLLRFECIGSIQGDTLYISGISAQKFTETIGFSMKEKIEKTKILTKKVQGSTVSDVIPFSHETLSSMRKVPMASISHHYYKYEQEILTPTTGTVLEIQQKLKSFGQETTILEKLTTGDLAYIEVTGIESAFEPIVYDFSVPEHKNFVAEGMVIHNTAFTDNLLAAAGLMSEVAAGSLDKGMATWQHADEQERLMTVDSANVSMVHEFDGKEFLINLIDTPGHIDFGGNVTRAMRAIDGTIVLVCASEGIMPQTETVLKQAIRERVKPVLFINKVDRLIMELKFTPEQMQKRFVEIVLEFNNLVENMAEEQFKKAWQVSITNGSVAFGAARENWALSIPYMQKKGVSFKDVLEIYRKELTEKERQEWIWNHCPLDEVALDMAIKHLPNPLEAQKYRIPKIWSGELDSELGKDLLSCNKNGKLAFVVTRILMDQKSGREITAGRLYSGTIKEGTTVYLNMGKQYQRIGQVLMYQGIKPEIIGEVPAGNVLALAGISATAGETITLEPEQPFEELKHIFEPVITKAIEPAKPQDLSKLVEVLRKVAKEDPSIKIEINQETGENLLHGMGELHLEIIEGRIKNEKGVDVKTSPPIVVYREAITKESPTIEGKSPNKHNKLYFRVEPISDELYAEIKAGNIPEGRSKKKDLNVRDILVKHGMDNKEALGLKAVHNGNLFFDFTRGIVQIGEIMELLLDMFEDVMDGGPLAREPCIRIKVILEDAKLHEDAIHRGPAQTYPAVRDGIKGAMMQAGPVLYEPLQVHRIEAPADNTGDVSKLVNNKRGQIQDMREEGTQVIVIAKMPVAEMIGWSSDLRSATGGRGHSYLQDQTFERVPSELQGKITQQLRTRKGLTEGQVGA